MKKLPLTIFTLLSLFLTGCFEQEPLKQDPELMKQAVKEAIKETIIEARELGKSAIEEGTSDAIAAIYINQAQQIQAAAIFYNVKKGNVPPSINSLGDYLTGVPESSGSGAWNLSGSNRLVYIKERVGTDKKKGVTTDVCRKINNDGAGLVKCVKFKRDIATSISRSNEALMADMAIIYMSF